MRANPSNRLLFPWKFSLRTLLVAVAAIAVGLAGDRAYQRWYARNYPGYYVSEVAHVRVRDGDTFDQTRRHFDSWRAVGESDREWADIARIWQGQGWPIQPGDEIFHFDASRHGVYFQFRQGRVVNADSGHDLLELARINHYPAPPVWLRYGFWPLYLLCIASAMLALWSAKTIQHRRSARVADVTMPGVN